MCSEKKRLANQQNAQKSTGPKTEEGKMRSRRNALKHGLTGNGTVLSRADEARLQSKLEQMRKDIEPITKLEDEMVKRMALASLRMAKCVKKEFAELERARKRAIKRWETKQLAIATETAQKLAGKDPVEAVEELESTSIGCDLLIEAWDQLVETLNDKGAWTPPEINRALALLGVGPQDPVTDNERAVQLFAHVKNLPPADEPTAEHEATRTALRAIIKTEQERLDELAEKLFHENDEPAREEIEDCASIDTTQKGMRLHQYEKAAEMSYHRNLSKLVHLRKIEPEHQSLTRFHKTGRMKPRRWNGINYEPTNPYYWSTADPNADAGVGGQGLGDGQRDQDAAGRPQVSGEACQVSADPANPQTQAPNLAQHGPGPAQLGPGPAQLGPGPAQHSASRPESANGAKNLHVSADQSGDSANSTPGHEASPAQPLAAAAG